jgi:hypothetical protein
VHRGEGRPKYHCCNAQQISCLDLRVPGRRRRGWRQ